jgi:hypothetical protein
MFIREKKTITTTILQLVKNERGVDGKVRQRIVLSLGNLKIPDDLRKTVAHEVECRMNGYERLMPLDYEVAQLVDEIINRLGGEKKLPPVAYREITAEAVASEGNIWYERIDHEQGTLLGPLLPLLHAWESLGLSEFLKEHGFKPRPIRSAQISIFNRLLDPCSENELINWAETTALNEVLGERIELGGNDRFYRAADKLLACRDTLETYLREREHELFNLNRTIVLYDLTNSYFEGRAEANPKARRSVNSKENRSDCPLLSVGLVLDGDGFVLTHKVFSGNLNDSKVMVAAVEDLQHLCGNDKRPLVVLDGGIASADNLEYLTNHGFDYVVNGKRTTRRRFAADFLELEHFRKVGERDDKAPVLVRRIESDTDYILLCRSNERKKKEDAMVSKTEEKLLAELAKLVKRIAKNDGKLHLSRGAETINRNIGRICSKYTRAAKFYDIEFDLLTRTLSWHRKDDEYQADAELHGCYHLRCSRPDLTNDEIWHIYITLTKVEDAFRLMKSDLGLRPFFHQKEDRCDSHIWITVLAYHLLHWIEYSLRLSGYEASWRKVRRLLTTHCYATIVIPSPDGLIRRIRKPGRPDERQRLIYDLLGIDWKSLPVHKKVFRCKM